MLKKLLGTVVAMTLICCGKPKPATTTPAGGPPQAEAPAKDESVFITPEVMEEIERTFKRNQPQILRCFNQGIAEGKVAKNKDATITIGLRVLPGGKTEDVKAVESTVEPPEIEECMLKAAASWPMPSPEGPVPFSYTYTFLPVP